MGSFLLYHSLRCLSTEKDPFLRNWWVPTPSSPCKEGSPPTYQAISGWNGVRACLNECLRALDAALDFHLFNFQFTNEIVVNFGRNNGEHAKDMLRIMNVNFYSVPSLYEMVPFHCQPALPCTHTCSKVMIQRMPRDTTITVRPHFFLFNCWECILHSVQYIISGAVVWHHDHREATFFFVNCWECFLHYVQYIISSETFCC